MSCDVGEAAERLENEQSSFRRFTYITAHSPNLPLLHLRHSSFSNPSFASLTSQALHLCHSSFSNPSAALPTSQLNIQPFRCFAYVIGTSPTSQVILQSFLYFTYVTGTSRTSSGEPPMHRGMKKQSVVD